MNSKFFKSTLLALFLFSLGSPAQAEVTNPYETIIAAVVTVESEDEAVEVLINTREEWIREGRLIDGYDDQTADLVDEITEKLNLCTLQESIYEACHQDRTAKELISELESIGVEVPADFQAWAQEELK